jgi:hypothetical protein
MLRKRTTGPGVSGPLGRSERPVKAHVASEWRITPSRISRVAVELARERRRIAHRPTVAQLRMMALLDGRAPSSYRLDPDVNWLPESLPVGFPHGADGLCFAHAAARSWWCPTATGSRSSSRGAAA